MLSGHPNMKLPVLNQPVTALKNLSGYVLTGFLSRVITQINTIMVK